MKNKKVNFEDFTGLYELSKTLRFELKAVGNTQKILEENNVFQKDELIQKKYTETKKYFDRLHREFVKDALQDVGLSGLDNYKNALNGVKTITRKTSVKDRRALEIVLEKEEERLRKEIVGFFNQTAKIWATKKYSGLKKKNIEILFEEGVFESILLEKYGKNDDGTLKKETTEKVEVINKKTGETETIEQSIFLGWKGFTGYFTKFFETRRNFYKYDGTSTALATRIVDQNLRRFCDNLNDFEKIKDEIDFSEVEEKFDVKIVEVFSLNFYNKCLLQEGIDFYNKILGGETLENGEKLKGVNELINKYRQDNKGEKLPFLKLLDKQILSEKEVVVFGIEDEKELLTVLQKFQEVAIKKSEILKNLFKYFVEIKNDKEIEKIYISKEAFNTISRKWTFETDIFEESLAKVFKEKEKKDCRKNKKDGEGFTFPDFISVLYIKLSLTDKQQFWKDRYYIDPENKSNGGFLRVDEKDCWQEFLEIFDYEFKGLFEKEIIDNKTGNKKIIGFDKTQVDFQQLLNNSNFTLNKDEKLNRKEKIIIKEFADNVLRLYQMAKYFSVEKKRKWNPNHLELGDFYTSQKVKSIDESFDGYEVFYSDAYEEIVQKYNDIRNYLTKKPWTDAQKWKLNFEKSNLLGGWPDSPKGNTQYGSFIFRKGTKYFLGVTDFPRLFDEERFSFVYVENSNYEKMVYKQVDAKTLYGSVYKGLFGSKYSEDQKTIDDKELLQRIRKVLETKVIFFPEFKTFIDKIDKNKYENAKSLAREISTGSFYNISFVPVSEKYVLQGKYHIEKNKKGDTTEKMLYLFEIHNKDWNLKDNKIKTGTKNLHTMYFENLFSQANIDKNFVLKLNGQAEIFYRPKAIDVKKVKRNFPREIIEKKRYTENKIFFHMPMTLNRGVGKPFAPSFNRKLNEVLANNPDINVIGVDRGEKHLAYYSVINQKQEILDSGTLNRIENIDENGNAILLNEKEIIEIRNDKNEIKDYELKETGKKVPYTDYKLLLEYKDKKRLAERQTWQAIEGIKDLKKGYISQVVRKLVDLAIKHHAIIVLEDLNMRFKQIRGGIEKSVYQQLEKGLIDKLNYLANKGEKDSERAGHLLKAYQLAAPFKTFKDMGKQTGILFYTMASYTSKIDPVTGWRPNLYLKKRNAKNNKETISNFSKIEFVNDRFEITYDLETKFAEKTQWTVCSNVERFHWDRKLNNNKGGYTYYENLTDNFKELFEKFKIDITGNILEQIKNIDETKTENKKFFSEFVFLFRLVCQIRNTDNSEKAIKDGKDDFILSPIKDKNGEFFDSRKDNGKHLPKNGDDNGAFNIARKGILTLTKITEWADENVALEKLGKKEKYSPDLFISNQDWDNFAQK